MKELDMIKAFAELEGIELTYSCAEGLLGEGYPAYYAYEKEPDSNEFYEYNPITDWELTFKAMVDYDVQKSQSMVNPEKTMISIRGSESVVSVFIRKEIPHAIIECILKSKGLWND